MPNKKPSTFRMEIERPRELDRHWKRRGNCVKRLSDERHPPIREDRNFETGQLPDGVCLWASTADHERRLNPLISRPNPGDSTIDNVDPSYWSVLEYPHTTRRAAWAKPSVLVDVSAQPSFGQNVPPMTSSRTTAGFSSRISSGVTQRRWYAERLLQCEVRSKDFDLRIRSSRGTGIPAVGN